MLQPLKQYICDSCNQVIEQPEDGWIEWLNRPAPKATNPEYHGFRIAHHNGRCERYLNHIDANDNHLNHFLDDRYKLQLLYGFLDKGPMYSKDFDGADVKDIREFTELLRRLTLPYYEEARQYFSEAKREGFFESENDVTMYSAETLKRLINQYSGEG